MSMWHWPKIFESWLLRGSFHSDHRSKLQCTIKHETGYDKSINKENSSPGAMIASFPVPGVFTRPPAIWMAILVNTIWQMGSSVHSFKGSTDWQASKNRVVFTNFSNSRTVVIGHEPLVRFVGWAEQRSPTVVFAPILDNMLSVSEKQ